MLSFEKNCGLKLIKEIVTSDSTISRIYGFILYTSRHPYVAKVLRDNAFWDSLNEISGSNWPIFAVRPLQQGSYSFKGGGPPGTMSMMVSTWDEPSSNMPIIRDFGLTDSKELPLFVVFMWDDNDELQQLSIHIMGDDEKSVYSSLETIVSTISQTEEMIEPQYKRTVNVFRNVTQQLEALSFKNTIKSRGKIAMRFAEYLSAFIKPLLVG